MMDDNKGYDRIIPARAGFTGRRGEVGHILGIIPARAGFTHGPAQPVRGHPDHPRSRGVYSSAQRLSSWSWGSSPLARGLHEDASRPPLWGGIIPARAGFTTPTEGSSPRRTDHPRSRGVYVVSHGGSPRGVGSSPLARGLLVGRQRDRATVGIIPARAGFTRRSREASGEPGDHPRSRGVYRPPRRRACPV